MGTVEQIMIERKTNLHIFIIEDKVLTYKQGDRQINRQMDRYIDRNIDRYKHIQIDKQRDRSIYAYIDRQIIIH